MNADDKAKKQRQADDELRKLKAELADTAAGEEQCVQEAIASDVRTHERILTRSRELGSRRVLRA